MKLGIRTGALLMVLVPTLVSAIALSAWHTRLRLDDARTALELRGQRESAYLADASELALLVGDSESLRRLAASNLKASNSAAAVLFIDADERLLASAGSAEEVSLAVGCRERSLNCGGRAQRYLFEREVSTRKAGDPNAAAFDSELPADQAVSTLLGRVLLSFDPGDLAALQRGMLWEAVVITLVALLFGALFARLLSGRVSAPIQALSTVVERIRGGDLSARTRPAGTGELRLLEEGVNAMANRVEEAAADLNRRVDEATIELSRALMERDRQNRELDQALAETEAAGRAKDLFLARMSHELRTPLSTVAGYARLMHRSGSAAERAEFYRNIEQAVAVLKTTVDDVLYIEQLENGALHLDESEFDVESCVEDVVRMLALSAHAKNLELVCHAEQGLARRVKGDKVRVSQVLGNLISNAIKFTQSGSVRLNASAIAQSGGLFRIVFEVTDTGIGIAPENHAHLFHPFVQADESITRRFGGSGLGLSISQGIVHAYGGTIRLRSEPGVGTTVRVELPLPLVDVEDDAAASPVDACVLLLCPDTSGHLPVLLDYLRPCFRETRHCATDSGDAMDEIDLLLVVEQQGYVYRNEWRRGQLPVLYLRPVGDMSAIHSEQLPLPLPVRRRQLLAACRGLLGLDVMREETVLPALTEQFELQSLLVEDNELNRRMMATQLRQFGVSVLEAQSGKQALDLLAQHTVGLALLDVHMPEMDGIALARRIRERHPATPVYALTANVVGSEEQELIQAGVIDVLYKPVVEQALRRLLERHGKRVRAAYQWHLPPGVSGAEVRAEFKRLCDAVSAHVMGDSMAQDCVDAAHQMLGVARMYTRGSLDSHCLKLETALRAADIDTARGELQCIRAALNAR